MHLHFETSQSRTADTAPATSVPLSLIFDIFNFKFSFFVSETSVLVMLVIDVTSKLQPDISKETSVGVLMTS